MNQQTLGSLKQGDHIAQWANHADDYRLQMAMLCDAFACLDSAPGTLPWDQYAFAKWASGPISSGERLAAQFVLSVWNNRSIERSGEPAWFNQDEYSVGVFDPVEAIDVWDDQSKSVFLAWCMNPFYP